MRFSTVRRLLWENSNGCNPGFYSHLPTKTQNIFITAAQLRDIKRLRWMRLKIFRKSVALKRLSLGGIREITRSIKESAVAHYLLFMLLLLVNYLLGRAAPECSGIQETRAVTPPSGALGAEREFTCIKNTWMHSLRNSDHKLFFFLLWQ